MMRRVGVVGINGLKLAELEARWLKSPSGYAAGAPRLVWRARTERMA